MTFPLALRLMKGNCASGQSRFGRAVYAFALVSGAQLQTPSGFPRDFSISRATFAGRGATSRSGVRSRALATAPRLAIFIISVMETFASDQESQIEVPEGISDPSKALAQVFLLGPIRIFRGGQRLEGGWRRKSLELLAYLAVHKEGVAKDQILEALWPETDPAASQRYFWQSASYLRCRLRGHAVDQRVLWQIDDLYRLDREAIWVDVMTFEDSIALSRSVHDSNRLLRFACDIYKGELCEGRYFSWSTRANEGLRSHFIEASQRLAESLAKRGEWERALVVLDRAVALDAFQEELTRRAMTMAAQMGRQDLVVRRFARLRRLMLADLCAEPSTVTWSTFRGLTAQSDPTPLEGGPHACERMT